MKAILIFFLILFLSSNFHLNAQDSIPPPKKDSSWSFGGTYNLNFGQTSLKNWNTGGENSITISSRYSPFLKYKKGKVSWESYSILGYGLIKGGDKAFNKTDDQFVLSTKFNHRANEKFKYSINLDFKTQFYKGLAKPEDSIHISNFLAPAYVVGALGIDYPVYDWLSISISPVSNKTTFVMDQFLADQGSFGVDKAEYDISGEKIKDGSTIRYEFGSFVKILIKKEIFKNVILTSKIDLFSNYLENPENIDVNIDVLLNFKINSFLSANIALNVIYDDDISVGIDDTKDGNFDRYGPRTQFKEIFGIGLNLKH